jgi:type VI secretion system protein
MKKIVNIIVCVLLSSCSSSPPKTKVEGIQVVAESKANQNTATALDIVFVYDTTAAGMLPKTGPDWFDKKAALVSGLAKSIDVVSLQVPPTMTVEVPLPKKYDKAIGVYSYANYLEAAGQPMGNLTPYKQMTIRLTPDNVIYNGN